MSQRVWRNRKVPLASMWTPELTRIVLAAALATMVALPLDAHVTAMVRAGDIPYSKVVASWTHAGQSQWYLVPTGIAFLVLGSLDWSRWGYPGRRLALRLYGWTGYAFAAIAVVGIPVHVLKTLFGRMRPIAFEAEGAYAFVPFSFGSTHASFPSGHSATCGAVVMAIILIWPRMAVPLLVAGLVAASARVASGAHYPADVVVGFTLGLLSAILLARWLAAGRMVFRLVPGRTLPVLR